MPFRLLLFLAARKTNEDIPVNSLNLYMALEFLSNKTNCGTPIGVDGVRSGYGGSIQMEKEVRGTGAGLI